MNVKTKHHIGLQPVGKRAEIEPGLSVLEAAQLAGVSLVSLCGGIGACDSCRVRLVNGELTPPNLEEQATFSREELAAGFRLACQAIPLSDVIVDIPPESLTTSQRLQVEGQDVQIRLDPVIRVVDVKIEPATIYDLRADTTRLHAALIQAGAVSPASLALKISHPVLMIFSQKIRQYDWLARVALRGEEMVAVLPPLDPQGNPTPILGLAVDVGTTKLAAYLVDLSSGMTLVKNGMMNPQIAYGEDVISRIAYIQNHKNMVPDGQQHLQSSLVDTLNQMAETMCAETGNSVEQIVEAVLVGNTVMHHIFAGLSVEQLGMAPYVPSVSEPIDLQAHQIGLRFAPGAYVHLPANIAGYVGADHVSMLLATLGSRIEQFSQTDDRPYLHGNMIALDIGTNTEITLSVDTPHGTRLVSCSCASGPAFEGAHIQDGMRAAPGAIERVQIPLDTIGEIPHPRWHTIDDQPPVGICGSGILDAVSEMYSAGVIDFRGVLNANHPSVRSSDKSNGGREFLLVPAEKTGHGKEIVVSRSDVNEIQLAKGAIRAGIEILLAEAGISAGQIDRFIIAGAFGTYIDVQSAVRVGMFPNLALESFEQVGNAAGEGARQMLVSAERRAMAQSIAGQIDYIELSAHPAFFSQFSKALFFPTEA